jgi:hypothetical protein
MFTVSAVTSERWLLQKSYASLVSDYSWHHNVLKVALSPVCALYLVAIGLTQNPRLTFATATDVMLNGFFKKTISQRAATCLHYIQFIPLA